MFETDVTQHQPEEVGVMCASDSEHDSMVASSDTSEGTDTGIGIPGANSKLPIARTLTYSDSDGDDSDYVPPPSKKRRRRSLSQTDVDTCLVAKEKTVLSLSDSESDKVKHPVLVLYGENVTTVWCNLGSSVPELKRLIATTFDISDVVDFSLQFYTVDVGFKNMHTMHIVKNSDTPLLRVVNKETVSYFVVFCIIICILLAFC